MENKKTSIHYLKARNSDFLAGVDLEIFQLEGRSKVLTITNVEYKENFKVNGKIKERGLIVYFEESYAKPLIVNSTNSKIIYKQTGIVDASKWVGFSIEFHFDPSVELMKKVVGGIRVKKVYTNGFVPQEVEDIKTKIDNAVSVQELQFIWNELSGDDQIKYKGLITNRKNSF